MQNIQIVVEKNLKSNSDGTKFYINFKHNGKQIRKLLDYSNKNWDKRTRVSKAKMELQQFKSNKQNSNTSISDTSSLDQVAEIYFNNRTPSNWTEELKSVYNLHIKPRIGKMKIGDIKTVHIDSLAAQMRKKGATKQTKNGCSARTIKKVTIECLRPILEYAVDNDIIIKVPKIVPPKKDSTKKLVLDAQNKFVQLYNLIMNEYKDDPFYRTLFLFALYARRLNEILTLEWSDIDFNLNQFKIRAINNKIGRDQIYNLPNPISQALHEFKDSKDGLVFKSPVTGKKMSSPKWQLQKLKKKSNIQELTMHYFRHIAASTLASVGANNNLMATALGHTDMQTVSKHYATMDNLTITKQTNDMLSNLVSHQVTR